MKQSKTFASGFPVEETIESLRQQLAEANAEIERLKYAQENPKFNGRYDTWQAVAGKYRAVAAASQAREQQLLKKVENYKILCQDENHYSHYLDALEALALPADTAALEGLIAKAGEVMRERCAQSGMLVANNGIETAGAIRAIPVVTLEDLKCSN